VEPFGIRTTLVEPGMIRSTFYQAATRVPVSPARLGRFPRAHNCHVPDWLPRISNGAMMMSDLQPAGARQLSRAGW